jgi:hypothetical protein
MAQKKATKKTATKKPATKKTVAKKTAPKKAVVKKAAPKKAAPKKAAKCEKIDKYFWIGILVAFIGTAIFWVLAIGVSKLLEK